MQKMSAVKKHILRNKKTKKREYFFIENPPKNKKIAFTVIMVKNSSNIK